LSELAEDVPKIDFIVEECTTYLESLPENEDDLTEDELLAIALYTWDLKQKANAQNFFYVANKVLQDRQQQKLDTWAVYFYYFQNGLAKIPACPSGTLVFRGIPAADKQLIAENYTLGRKIHWSGYSSSSVRLVTAKKFAGSSGIIMAITVTDGKPLERYSPYKEQEILLSPNMQLLVSKAMYFNEDDGYYYLELTQIVAKKTFVF